MLWLGLAINKLLALAGRDEPRDYVDVLYVHERVLPLGALCWVAAGAGRGFTHIDTPCGILACVP